jgi:hypothetical protein
MDGFRKFEKGQFVNFLGKKPWVFGRISLNKPVPPSPRCGILVTVVVFLARAIPAKLA